MRRVRVLNRSAPRGPEFGPGTSLNNSAARMVSGVSLGRPKVPRVAVRLEVGINPSP